MAFVLILVISSSAIGDCVIKRKDSSVECKFHAIIIDLLFEIDEYYRVYESEAILTSGSEHTTRHSYTSLHYARPAKAVDLRVWDKTSGRGSVPAPEKQLAAIEAIARDYANANQIPVDWIEVYLEDPNTKNAHIHIEYQEKRSI